MKGMMLHRCLAIAASFFLAACSQQESPKDMKSFIVPPLQPDSIRSFGYKCGWIAVRTDDLQAVIDALELKECRVSSWAEGVESAYRYPHGEVFVTPPIHGYILCASFSLPEFPTYTNNPDEITPLLKRLAARFPDVQYFFTYRVVDGHAWARYQNGTCTRAFAIVQGEQSWNTGEPTSVEKDIDLEFPSEDDVMKIAEDWSINPAAFEEKPMSVTQGIVGKL